MENDVVENEIINAKRNLEERIEQNRGLFTKDELIIIDKNDIITLKIYLLGLIDGREIYGKKLQ